MTPSLSTTLNALGLIAIAIVLSAAFADQLLYQDLPCPLCLLQRAGLIAAGFGIALNLVFGPRPSHYGIAILGALVGMAASVRQILLHIVPGTGSYGDAIFGLHLYTWALMIFTLVVAGCGIMLLFDRQFGGSGRSKVALTPLGLVALAAFGALILANIVSTLAICGAGLCPDDPKGYLLFRENLRTALQAL